MTNDHSIYVSKLKSDTVLIFVPTVPFVPQITQKAKNCKEKFRLQRRSGSEERDKRPQIGRKNDKRTQIGMMPIARRSRAGERFDVNFSVCLLHAALPEILLPASSVQAAPPESDADQMCSRNDSSAKNGQIVQLQSLPLKAPFKKHRLAIQSEKNVCFARLTLPKSNE